MRTMTVRPLKVAIVDCDVLRDPYLAGWDGPSKPPLLVEVPGPFQFIRDRHFKSIARSVDTLYGKVYFKSMMTLSDSPGDRLLLRGVEVAQLMGCSRALAYRLMATGRLPIVRVGIKGVRVPRAALVEWVRKNTLAAQ